MSDSQGPKPLPPRPRHGGELRTTQVVLRFTASEADVLRKRTGYDSLGDAVQSLCNPILDEAGV